MPNITTYARTLAVAEGAGPTPIGIAAPTEDGTDTGGFAVSITTVPDNGSVFTAGGYLLYVGAVGLTVTDLVGLQFAPSTIYDSESSLGYTVDDGNGVTADGAAVFDVAAGSGESGPSGPLPDGVLTVSAPSLSVTENAAATAIGIAAPVDTNANGGDVTATVVSLPNNGIVSLADGTAVQAGQALTVAQLTGLQFTPSPGLFGANSTLEYTAADTAGETASGTVALAIGPALGSPVVSAASLTVRENAAATPIGIPAPTDPNFGADQLTVTIGSLPQNGLVSLASGQVVTQGEAIAVADLMALQFTPTPGQFGQSSTFTYTVADSAQNSTVGTATLAIPGAPSVDPVTSATLPAITPGHSGNFLITDVPEGISGQNDGTAYTGPVSYLQQQFIWGGSEAVAISSQMGSVFLKGGSGGDALKVSSGNNVLDGGGGSNFLIGATGGDGGADVFFVDARGSAVTWSTVVNFHQGDQFTLWGFRPQVSTSVWDDWSGATGFEGVSMHSETNGEGTGVNASVTFAGVTRDTANAHFITDTGDIDGTPYLHITYG